MNILANRAGGPGLAELKKVKITCVRKREQPAAKPENVFCDVPRDLLADVTVYCERRRRPCSELALLPSATADGKNATSADFGSFV
jgi:hypothetical protein